MNKVVLCKIQLEEMESYELLLQNRATFLTLLQIKEEKGALSQDILCDINQKISQTNRSISDWWETITTKYGIPYYMDKQMLVNAETKEVYVQ